MTSFGYVGFREILSMHLSTSQTPLKSRASKDSGPGLFRRGVATIIKPLWVLRLQGVAHGIGIAGDNDKVGACCRIRLFTALLPIAQCAERNVEPPRKLLLAKSKRPPNDFHLRCGLHALYVVRRNGLCVRIA